MRDSDLRPTILPLVICLDLQLTANTLHSVIRFNSGSPSVASLGRYHIAAGQTGGTSGSTDVESDVVYPDAMVRCVAFRCGVLRYSSALIEAPDACEVRHAVP